MRDINLHSLSALLYSPLMFKRKSSFPRPLVSSLHHIFSFPLPAATRLNNKKTQTRPPHIAALSFAIQRNGGRRYFCSSLIRFPPPTYCYSIYDCSRSPPYTSSTPIDLLTACSPHIPNEI